MTLQCGIVGAGIAGLGAAIALRRAGHEVEIFEKSQFKHEIGAAITLTPNANLILDRWGFDAARARETDKLQYRFLESDTLKCSMYNDFSQVRERFGHNFNAFHRVDLHSSLKDLAISGDQPGPTPRIQLGSEVVELDCDAGILKLNDGVEIKKDLIVVADGVKTKFIETIAGVDIPLHKMDKSIYRTLIPMDRLMNDPLIRPLLENQPSGQMEARNMQTKMLQVIYPCRDDELMNFALFHDTRPDQRDKDDWNSPATVQDAIDQLQKGGFHPVWEAITRHADEMKCYNTSTRDVLPRMVRGKAVLIGDAAHAMSPAFAQGGSMALEDAATLETFFSSTNFNVSDDSVEKRLELLNQFRMPRNCVTQLMSNAGKMIDPKIRKYYTGPLPLSSKGWYPPVQDFFYSYDVFKEAEKAMQCKDAEGGIPDGVIEHFGLKSGPETIDT